MTEPESNSSSEPVKQANVVLYISAVGTEEALEKFARFMDSTIQAVAPEVADYCGVEVIKEGVVDEV